MMVYLEAFFAGLFNALIQVLPLKLSRAIARFVGTLIYVFAATRKKIALQNVDRAFKDTRDSAAKQKIVKQAFENFALSVVDLFTIKRMKAIAKQEFHIQGQEHFEKAMAEGRGVILVTSHLGSWEYLSFLFYLTNKKCSVVVKKLKNKIINGWIDTSRREIGLNPIHKKDSMRSVLKVLKEKGSTAILIDQWAGPEGLWQPFFGEDTSTTSLPARLALRTGAVLLPAYCFRQEEGGYQIEVLPHLDPSEVERDGEATVTQTLNKILEEKIRRYPEQWIWGHRRWKSKPKIIREA